MDMSYFDLNSYKIIKETPRYVTISGDINNIGYDDNLSIVANGNLLRRGDMVLLNGNPNIIKNIEEVADRKTHFRIFWHILNKSSNFIAPFYGKDKIDLRWDKYFCNAYINYNGKPNVYLLFKYNLSTDNTSEDLEYLKFEKRLCSHKNFINTYELEEGTLFEFSIPDEYKNTINLILEGRYSEIDLAHKDLLIQFHNANEKTLIYGVLFKSELRKKEIEYLFGITVDSNIEYLGKFLEEEPTDISNKIKTKMLMYNEYIRK